jgi:ankyrin repeat protein
MIDARAEFIKASVWHGSLERSQAILAAHPEVATSDIFTASILGDDVLVRTYLASDPESATAKGAPLDWDALTHLCFSSYLRLDPARSDAFVRAAQALLDAGADARSGFWEPNHQPEPEWESAIYGAAGVAHHPELTRLLLQHGADPNDGETPYHAPETYDNRALEVLVDSGKLTAASLTMILLRKTDWHDLDGIRWLLKRGIDPNATNRFGKTALHNAILSDNALSIVEALLDHGADPLRLMERADTIRGGPAELPAAALAARRGRGDVLELFERRAIPVALEGLDGLLAACARNDTHAVQSLAAREPSVVDDLVSDGGSFLASFAANGNTDGVRHLLDLGVNVAAPFRQGNSYMGIASDSTALHAAAWLARHDTVALLIARGAPADTQDGKGRTPLALAVRACVDSYWTRRRSPASVAALLNAGASVTGVMFPSGYAEVDELLQAHGAGT